MFMCCCIVSYRFIAIQQTPSAGPEVSIDDTNSESLDAHFDLHFFYFIAVSLYNSHLREKKKGNASKVLIYFFHLHFFFSHSHKQLFVF